MLVRAKRAFFDRYLVRANTVFEWEGGKLPSYLEPVGEPEEPSDEVVVAGKRGRRTKTRHDEVTG